MISKTIGCRGTQHFQTHPCTGPSLMLLPGFKNAKRFTGDPPALTSHQGQAVLYCCEAGRMVLVKCTFFLVAICDRWRWSKSLFSYIFHPQMEKVGVSTLSAFLQTCLLATAECTQVDVGGPSKTFCFEPSDCSATCKKCVVLYASFGKRDSQIWTGCPKLVNTKE